MAASHPLRVKGRPLSHSQSEEVSSLFAALADPIRLRLFDLVSRAGSQGICSCDLVEPLERSQPTISHHLKILREAGLVESRRDGTWMWYSVVPQHVELMNNFLSLALSR